MTGFQRDWWHADLVAGLTVAAVVIPKSLAMAAIAGVPVEAGLYAALAALLVYPLLGGSRVLSVNPTSSIAMLTAVPVVALAAGGIAPGAVATTLALLVGMILVAARLLRLGFLANFISKPVLVGFEAGLGVVLVVGQLKSVLGAPSASSTTVGILWDLPAMLAHAHAPTMLVAAAGLALLFGLPRLAPRVSAPLLWVALSVAASAFLALSQHGVKVVGTVPSGLPPLAWPDLSIAAALWPAALGMALMSFTESVATARTFCRRDDPPVDANRELLAVGVANLAASVVGGMAAGGGASQSAIVDKAGARSLMAQWVNATMVVLTLLALAQLISLLPQAALGALILAFAVGMIKPAAFRAIGRVRRTELAWALSTMAGVIVLGTLEGILIAVAISVLTLIYQANHPPVYEVAYQREKSVFQRLGEDAHQQTFPGLLMLRTEGRLTFANAANAADKMGALVARADPGVIVLECSAIPDIEYTALLMLTEAEENLRARGVTLWLAAVNPDLRRLLDRAPLGEALGPQRIFDNLYKALEAWQRSGAATPDETRIPTGAPR